MINVLIAEMTSKIGRNQSHSSEFPECGTPMFGESIR